MNDTIRCPFCAGVGFRLQKEGSSPHAFLCTVCEGAGEVTKHVRGLHVNFRPANRPVVMEDAK